MKIVNFTSGLGNQIFQYYFYLYLKQQFKKNIFGYYNLKFLSHHNGLEIFNVFDIEKPSNDKRSDMVAMICRILNRGVLKNILVSSDLAKKMEAIYFNGYWQNKLYYINSPKLKFKTIELSNKNKSIMEQIENTNSVSIHIRRGDYLSHSSIKLYGNICTLDYYQKAIEHIENNIIAPHYFIFSDDIEWAKENIDIKNALFINWNNGSKSYIDMYLMTQCKSHILANSTFSYWGAYFSKHIGINICPEKWTSEVNSSLIAMKDWILL